MRGSNCKIKYFFYYESKILWSNSKRFWYKAGTKTKCKRACDSSKGVLRWIGFTLALFHYQVQIYATNEIDIKIFRIKLLKDPKCSKNIFL